MANVLNNEKKQQILALGQLGWSLRRIHAATHVRRETISTYLKVAGVGVWSGGWGRQTGSKPAIGVTTGFGVELRSPRSENPGRNLSASACEPFQEAIDLGLSRGRNAMAIWQDLVSDYGFTSSYQSVKRYKCEPLIGRKLLSYRWRASRRIGCPISASWRAVEARDLSKAEECSAQFDAELWRRSQQPKDSLGMQAMAANNAPAGPPKLEVMPDALLQPILSTLSIMSLELRASLLTAQKQSDEARKLFAQAAQEEKELGYREPPVYIRPVGETEGAALMVHSSPRHS